MNIDQIHTGKAALMPITSRPDPVFVRGQGMWLWDQQEQCYLDFVQGWAVNCLGHCPPVLVQCLAKQASQLLTPSPAYFNGPSLELAGLLVEHSAFEQVFFTNSGAEAVEGAIKLARRASEARYGAGRHEIITVRDAFHGRTLAAMSASGKAEFAPMFEPKVSGFPKAILNDIDSVRELICARTCAVMIEPIQGEAGVIPASREFMRELRELTGQHDLLLIFDEVQTGVGRTGHLWAYESAGVTPDIMAVGKGIGGGVPLGALLAKKSVGQFAPGEQGGTYNGNALMTAAGAAVLREVAQPAFLAQVRHTSHYLQRALADLSQRFDLGEVRGQGLLLALGVPAGNAHEIAAQALRNGLLINAPRRDCLRLMPALNVSEAEIDQMADCLSAAFSASLSAAS